MKRIGKKVASRKEVALELLQNRLVHISNRSLMDDDTENVCQYIELRIDTEPFCTSCQISSMNKKSRSKNTLKPKELFK